jgi:hypothetical protein
LVAFYDSAENRIRPAKQPGCNFEITGFHRGTNEGAADNLPIDLDRGHPDFIEAKFVAERLQEVEVAGASFAKTPFITDANLAQRAGRGGEPADELIRGSLCKLGIEGNREQMLNAQVADEPDLVNGRRKQARHLVRAQDARGMRVECDDHGRPASSSRIVERASNYCLMSQVDAIEYADGQEKRSLDLTQLGDGMQDVH